MRPPTILIAAAILCTPAFTLSLPPDGAAATKPSAEPAPPKISLKPGNPPPPISADTWINGSPIPRLEPGKIYIVEFWATWCGPCVKNIPHLNDLQKKYPAITIIGIAASEPPPRQGLPDRREPNLRAFIARQGDAMRYRIAYDSRQSVYDAWMTASGNATIPKTFLIGADNKIAWIGHPDDLEPELEKAMKAARAAAPGKGPTPSPPASKAPTTPGQAPMRLRPLP